MGGGGGGFYVGVGGEEMGGSSGVNIRSMLCLWLKEASYPAQLAVICTPLEIESDARGICDYTAEASDFTLPPFIIAYRVHPLLESSASLK